MLTERLIPLVWLLVICPIALTQAALPPKAIDDLMADAPAHLQGQISSVQLDQRPIGVCRVTLSVQRIFRDTTGTLTSGQAVDLAIYCFREPHPHELSPGTMPGTMHWIDHSRLDVGKLLEAYVFRDDKAWHLQLGALVWPIDNLTATPLHDPLHH